MYTIAIANLIAVLFLGVTNAWNKKHSMIYATTILLILFYGIRVNYGNDYAQYELMFRHINAIGNGAVMSNYVRVEEGYILLNKLFGRFDFSVFVFFHTIIQFGSVAWFIKRYVPHNMQWAVLALYLFWPQLMLMGLSQMRQTIAMSILLFATPYFLEKKVIKSTLIILLAVQFHTSALIGFAFLIISYFRNINYIWAMIIFTIVVVSETIFRQSYLAAALQVMENATFSKYKYYTVSADDMRTGLGYMAQLAFALYMIWITHWKSVKNRFFIYSLVTFYAITPLTSVLGMIIRLGYYFQLMGIIAFPELIKRMRRDAAAMAFGVMFLFLVFYSFVYFFEDPTWTRDFSHYTTLFGEL